jgi:hypothetical protein
MVDQVVNLVSSSVEPLTKVFDPILSSINSTLHMKSETQKINLVPSSVSPVDQAVNLVTSLFEPIDKVVDLFPSSVDLTLPL